MNSIEKEFYDTLQILSDFKTDAGYLVAFSGGVDSLALLLLCSSVVRKERIHAVYVNHNIRNTDELQNEINLNAENCRKAGIGFTVREINRDDLQKLSKEVGTEAAARKLRYSILEEERVGKNLDYILTAHHRNDQVETVLMRIINRAPVSGLRGISEKWNKTLRPLLEFDKSELERYVRERGYSHSTDSTNKDNRYRRNEIRNEILPQLRTVMQDCEQRILNIRNRAVNECAGTFTCGSDSVPVSCFDNLNPTQKALVLYQMWDNEVGTSLPQTLVSRVIDSLGKKDSFTESANGGTFCSYNGILYVVDNSKNDLFKHFYCELKDGMVKYVLPGNITFERIQGGKTTDIMLDFSLFNGKVILRFADEGEQIKLKDGRKTVNKLLQDMKVPPVFRDRVPVISDDDGLCAVFGSVYGGKNRICSKLRTSIADTSHYRYICYK